MPDQRESRKNRAFGLFGSINMFFFKQPASSLHTFLLAQESMVIESIVGFNRNEAELVSIKGLL